MFDKATQLALTRFQTRFGPHEVRQKPTGQLDKQTAIRLFQIKRARDASL